MSKLNELSPVQVALTVLKQVLEDHKPLNDLEFHITPRMFGKTRLFPLPFAHLYAVDRLTREWASPDRYLSELTIAVDIVDEMDFDEEGAERRTYNWEGEIERAVILNSDLPDHEALLPDDIVWEGMEYQRSKFLLPETEEDEDERLADEAICMLEVRFVRLVDS